MRTLCLCCYWIEGVHGLTSNNTLSFSVPLSSLLQSLPRYPKPPHKNQGGCRPLPHPKRLAKLSALNGMRVMPSGRLPSVRGRPTGTGISAEEEALANTVYVIQRMVARCSAPGHAYKRVPDVSYTDHFVTRRFVP